MEDDASTSNVVENKSDALLPNVTVENCDKDEVENMCEGRILKNEEKSIEIAAGREDRVKELKVEVELINEEIECNINKQNEIVFKTSPNGKLSSPPNGKLLPQCGKVSTQTGKVSPKVSTQIVVRFSNCSRESENDLPYIQNENDVEMDSEKAVDDDDKENVFKEAESAGSLNGDCNNLEDNPDSRRTSGRTSSYLSPIQMKLRKACREGDISTLQKILEENPGIKLDLLDEEGSTCLNESVTKSCQFEDVTKLLLDAGAGISVQDQLGNTPLHNAVLYYPATEETIQMLLDKGADTSIRNFEGATPISMADDKDLKKVMRLLGKSSAKSCGKLTAKRRLPYTNILSRANESASPADFKIVVEESPGTPSILKKREGGKRKREEGEGEERVKRRRIRFNEKEEATVKLFSEDD